MKGSLMEEFGADVHPHLVDSAMPEDSYATVCNNIHTSYVSRAIASRAVNPVVNCQPPTVANFKAASSNAENLISTALGLFKQAGLVLGSCQATHVRFMPGLPGGFSRY